MIRRLSIFASAVSLLLCMAAAALWVRSYIGDGGGWEWTLAGKRYHLGMSEGTVGADLTTDPLSTLTINSIYHSLGIFLVIGRMGTSLYFRLSIPLWMPTVAFLLPPIVFAMRWYWSRTAIGHCLRCGYNLSGNTSGICPECGTPVSGERAAKS